MNQISQEKPKQVLFSIINSLLDNRDEFLVNPQSDFTRSKKITFSQTILFPMIAGSDNVATELLDYFGENNPPLPSAMIQRRNQVKPEAFKELFLRFTLNIPKLQTFHGYQLVSVDGSRINLPYNPSDESSFIHSIKGRKGINQVHLNALYDPLNDIFLDAILQGIHEMDEKAAFTTFLDQYDRKSGNKIFLADRGYASYNIFAHAIHNQELFLIRLPESFAKAICPNRERWLEGDCSDENVTINIGRNRKKKNLQLENYHCIPKSGHYDYIEAGTDNIDTLKMRILKFPIAEDSYEYIVTNLPAYAFSLSTIKNLYNLRWNEETAFRHLKYAGNMVHIHSLKKEFYIQEIFGKLTMYNFSSFLSQTVSTEQTDCNKYTYNLNHTQLQKICIRFLKGVIQDVSPLIQRFLVPVRPDRKFKRNLRRQSADTLGYR